MHGPAFDGDAINPLQHSGYFNISNRRFLHLVYLVLGVVLTVNVGCFLHRINGPVSVVDTYCTVSCRTWIFMFYGCLHEYHVS